MIREHFEYRETITTILADTPAHIAAAKEGMLRARAALEEYLRDDPFFGISYTPVPAAVGAPEIVQRMAAAAASADVGPMAAVAASIAWAGVEQMMALGASFGLIDNGGDIVLVSDRPVSVGIYAGDAPVSGKYAFIVPPSPEVLGICTSSATVGPSVSFGIADAVVVFSSHPAKADAWATGLCNTLIPSDAGVPAPPDEAGISAVYAVIGNWIGTWGDLPEIVVANVSEDRITKGAAELR